MRVGKKKRRKGKKRKRWKKKPVFPRLGSQKGAAARLA